MGFFSWQCAKCKQPVMNTHTGADPILTNIFLYLPDGRVIEGPYGGYGEIEGNPDVYELLGQPHNMTRDDVIGICFDESLNDPRFIVKMIHAVCRKEDDSFETLPESEDDSGQGFFWEDNDIRRFERKVRELSGCGLNTE